MALRHRLTTILPKAIGDKDIRAKPRVCQKRLFSFFVLIISCFFLLVKRFFTFFNTPHEKPPKTDKHKTPPPHIK